MAKHNTKKASRKPSRSASRRARAAPTDAVTADFAQAWFRPRAAHIVPTRSNLLVSIIWMGIFSVLALFMLVRLHSPFGAIAAGIGLVLVAGSNRVTPLKTATLYAILLAIAWVPIQRVFEHYALAGLGMILWAVLTMLVFVWVRE